MKKAYRFNHIELKKFGYKIEIACFNKHGGFKWALYLPTFKLITRRAFHKQQVGD